MKNNHQKIGLTAGIIAVLLVAAMLMFVSQNNQEPKGGGQEGTVPASISAPNQQNITPVNPDQSA